MTDTEMTNFPLPAWRERKVFVTREQLSATRPYWLIEFMDREIESFLIRLHPEHLVLLPNLIFMWTCGVDKDMLRGVPPDAKQE